MPVRISALISTGQPYFLILPTYDDLASGDALRAKAGPRTLVLKPRNPKPKSMNSFEQAGSHGVPADQNGRAVYYSTHMDLIYFDFTKTYFKAEKYKNAAPTLEYPIGATVLKAAWRVVAPGEDTSNVFTTTATIDLLKSDVKGGLETTKSPAKPPGFRPWRKGVQAACSISASSASPSSVLPRRGPFCSCVSITFNDSVSVSFCTTRISRAMRSSAVS